MTNGCLISKSWTSNRCATSSPNFFPILAPKRNMRCAQDYAMEMPQSGERIRGREKTIPSALHSLTLFLCTVRSDSVIMCT
jgi:hypothetical protein